MNNGRYWGRLMKDWRIVAAGLGMIAGMITVAIALVPPKPGSVSFVPRNEGTHLGAGDVNPSSSRPLELDARAVLTYPRRANSKQTFLLSAKLVSVFAKIGDDAFSHSVSRQLSFLYDLDYSLVATLDLAGADFDHTPRDLRSGQVTWSIRPKDDGTFAGVVRLDLKRPATVTHAVWSPMDPSFIVTSSEDAKFDMAVSEPPITWRDTARGALLVLGSFATLPGIWLFYREFRSFRREKAQQPEGSRSAIVTPEEYERDKRTGSRTS